MEPLASLQNAVRSGMIWVTDPCIEKPGKVVDRSNRYGSLTFNNALRRGLR